MCFVPRRPAEARSEVAQQATEKPDFIKVWVDDFWGQYPKLPPEIYGAIIDEAHKHSLRVAAHVYHLQDARLLVADGVDVLAHSIRDADVDNALIAEMKKHHVAYIPTLSLDDFAFAYGDSPNWVNDPFFTAALDPGVLEMITSPEYKAKVQANKVTAQEKAALPEAMRNLKKIYDAGILVSLGTDSGATTVRTQGFAEHMELALMVQAGLTPLRQLQSPPQTQPSCSRSKISTERLKSGKRQISSCWKRIRLKTFTTRKRFAPFGRMARRVSDGPLAAGRSAIP